MSGVFLDQKIWISQFGDLRENKVTQSEAPASPELSEQEARGVGGVFKFQHPLLMCKLTPGIIARAFFVLYMTGGISWFQITFDW